MKYISLTQGKRAIIDDENYAKVCKFKWCATASTNGRFYAIRNVKPFNGNQKRIWLHKIVSGNSTGFVIFKNGNPLDCRIQNLIFTSRGEATRSRLGYGKSQYKGVSVHNSKYKYRTKKGVDKVYQYRRYVAVIRPAGKLIYLGRFKDEIQAAKAYDTAAKAFYGDWVHLNFPDE